MDNDAVEITLFSDGISGSSMPLAINGENIVGNSGPLVYISRLEKALHVLRPNLRFDAAYPGWVTLQEGDGTQVENGIVWSIKKMLPINLGGKPLQNPEAGTREVKPRLRKDIFLDDGTALRVLAQKFTVFFQFNVFAKNPNDAEEIADWFQFGFMDHFGGLFGSHYTVFRQRLQDNEVEKLNQTFNVRSLEYIVDVERYTAIPQSLIDVIQIQVKDTYGNPSTAESNTTSKNSSTPSGGGGDSGSGY